MLVAPKTTISKKQYMLNIEEKKNRQTRQKMGREKWRENAAQIT